MTTFGDRTNIRRRLFNSLRAANAASNRLRALGLITFIKPVSPTKWAVFAW